jgi:autotransporter-associated beta strand protein
MGVTKSGLGTQTLTGANSYIGVTTISGGKLIVGDGTSGSLGNTAVNVTGGTLGGLGSIAGSVTVGGAGALAAGTASVGSTGKLSTGSLSLAGTLQVDVNTASNVADQVAVTGGVDVTGATLGLSFAGGVSGAYNHVFVLINNDGDLIADGADAIVGSFAGLTRGGPDDSATLSDGLTQATVYYGYDALSSSLTGGNDLAIQFTSVVPEPGVFSLISVAPIALLNRRRRRRVA